MVTENPYQSPGASEGESSIAAENRLGRIGFILSLAGVSAIFFLVPLNNAIGPVGLYLAFLCLPGWILSAIGLFFRPRLHARWGLGLGLFGTLYLPTMACTLFMSKPQ